MNFFFFFFFFLIASSGDDDSSCDEDETDNFLEITDEGVIALANLPKLESLELNFGKSITTQVFKHFRTLKNVKCFQIENIKEGLRDLLQNCSNFQEISLSRYIDTCSEEVIKTLKCAAKTLEERNYIGNPLLVSSDFGYVGGFRVRIVPIRFEKAPSKQLLFELFFSDKKCTPDIITYDLDIIIKQAKSLIAEYHELRQKPFDISGLRNTLAEDSDVDADADSA